LLIQLLWKFLVRLRIHPWFLIGIAAIVFFGTWYFSLDLISTWADYENCKIEIAESGTCTGGGPGVGLLLFLCLPFFLGCPLVVFYFQTTSNLKIRKNSAI
jgi:hypothetical protein